MGENLGQWLSIGALAQRSGVSVATLRFYEDKELIWSTRTDGNQRRYQRSMLRRIAIIKVAQQVGISLADIKQEFENLPRQGVTGQKDWQKMSKSWHALLDEKIIKLLQLRQQLDWCIGCGCLSMNECPLRNPNDQLGEQSAGAHFNQILFELDNKHLIIK